MSKSQTIKLPTKVVDSEWRDDIDYEPYEDEKTYVSPDSIKRETIAKIKRFPIKLTISSMIDWQKIDKELEIPA